MPHCLQVIQGRISLAGQHSLLQVLGSAVVKRNWHCQLHFSHLASNVVAGVQGCLEKGWKPVTCRFHSRSDAFPVPPRIHSLFKARVFELGQQLLSRQNFSQLFFFSYASSQHSFHKLRHVWAAKSQPPLFARTGRLVCHRSLPPLASLP